MKKSLNFQNIMFTSVVAALIFGVIGISYIRQNSTAIFTVTKAESNTQDALNWDQAVKSGQEKKAILCAKKIIPDDVPFLPNPDYIHLLLKNRLSTLIFTSPFNHFDYLRWKDAYEINRVVLLSSEKSKDVIPTLFQAVLSKQKPEATNQSMSLPEMFQVKISKYKDKPYVSIIDIWNKGYTSLDEFFRLFSAIAYQAGYEVQIITFYDDKWQPAHVVCEIRKGNKSYICDPIYRKLWNDMSIGKFTNNPDLIKGVWSDKKTKALKRAVHRLPAEAMDYKLFNRQLYVKLKEYGVTDLPLFGQNPQDRIAFYIKNYTNKVEKSHFSYWNFPFQSLMSSPTFPQEWKLPGMPKGNADEEKQ